MKTNITSYVSGQIYESFDFCFNGSYFKQFAFVLSFYSLLSLKIFTEIFVS